MIRSRKEWKEIVVYRLDDVYAGIIRKDEPNEIIHDLRSFSLVSEYYDRICLAVDVWHLFDKRPVPLQKQFPTPDIITDPFVRIFFCVVVQAIRDIRSGRPCDSHSWRVDIPPGNGQRCTPSEHFCKNNANVFICETATLWESVLNLGYGTLMEMITKENGSSQSRSQAVLNCTDQ